MTAVGLTTFLTSSGELAISISIEIMMARDGTVGVDEVCGFLRSKRGGPKDGDNP